MTFVSVHVVFFSDEFLFFSFLFFRFIFGKHEVVTSVAHCYIYIVQTVCWSPLFCTLEEKNEGNMIAGLIDVIASRYWLTASSTTNRVLQLGQIFQSD